MHITYDHKDRKLFLRRNKNIKRVFTLALVIFFNLSSLAGTAEPMLCIDQDDIHILVKEQFSLGACHTPARAIEEVNESRPNISAVCRQNSQTSCVDITSHSTTASISSRQVKKLLSKAMLSMLFFTQPPSMTQEPSSVLLKIRFQTVPPTFSLTSLQTIVLLI